MSLSFLDYFVCVFATFLDQPHQGKLQVFLTERGVTNTSFHWNEKLHLCQRNLPNILEIKNGAMQLVRQYIQLFGESPVGLLQQKPSNNCRRAQHIACQPAAGSAVADSVPVFLLVVVQSLFQMLSCEIQYMPSRIPEEIFDTEGVLWGKTISCQLYFSKMEKNADQI